ncbi:hypothetical protein BMS3Abin04_02720 [bacterium BMS3Abin04]|nr:hypothetical protein BMS3Abin04_02720 [bacterium BMS3Abin04]
MEAVETKIYQPSVSCFFISLKCGIINFTSKYIMRITKLTSPININDVPFRITKSNTSSCDFIKTNTAITHKVFTPTFMKVIYFISSIPWKNQTGKRTVPKTIKNEKI